MEMLCRLDSSFDPNGAVEVVVAEATFVNHRALGDEVAGCTLAQKLRHTDCG